MLFATPRRREKDVLLDEGYVDDAVSEDDATRPKPKRYGRRQQRPTQTLLDLAMFLAVSFLENITPSSSHPNLLARHPVFHASNTGTSNLSAQSGKSKSKRVRKTYSNLRLLKKPVK